jgi:predicted alpha/beta-hydrolase family hydrolase
MPRPLIVFAHGAGASSQSDWMQSWSKRLAKLGRVAPFDYPYMQRGQKRPDQLPVLIAAHRAAVVDARTARDKTVILAGKSMGSRVGCHLALEDRVDALVCLGYPLVSPGSSGAMRDEVLLALRTPILFVQGTRDALCPLDRLAAVRKKMKAPNALHVVESGDHSLSITAKHTRENGGTQKDADTAALEAIRQFLGEHAKI